ncbi:importin alpha re-exporter [Auriculariales sp. MPI-PUGE-AT-0066]|nr:importin alpha re-exporter [Auriculariales sp. MPI-PUGE-AT-0066]
MSDLSAVLLASLHPSTRKQAEVTLEQSSVQPGFMQVLLQLILNGGADRGARLAASVYFKNTVRKRWTDETDDTPIAAGDKTQLRGQIVPAMIVLAGPADKALRAQIAQSVTVIAKTDFPSEWPSLIDDLVNSLSPTDYAANLAVLETAHSIFVRWRAEARSDSLFTQINLVLSRFVQPFIELFRQTATLLLQGGQSPSDLSILGQAQTVMVTLFYDLTCQDLPPAFEDTHLEFFGPGSGWFIRFLAWDPPELAVEEDDANPSVPSQLKTAVLEVAQLYANLFTEMLRENGVIENFVQAVWELVGSGKTAAISDDQLVAQALRLLATLVRQGTFASLFQPAVVKSLIESVAVPNVYLREVDIEQFEDDPLEYIRRDMHMSDASTRRAAAADLLRSLVNSGKETEVTTIVGEWIGASLQKYGTNPQENWKDKDAAIYVLTAVAAKGGTGLQGITSRSMLIDVVEFFGQHIAQDLQAPAGSVHPILQVDAIKFLHTFRSQLTKEQLIQVLPLLVQHLASNNYVSMTYASIAVERILFLKKPDALSQPLFEPSDVQGFASGIIDALFTRIEAGGSPQKVAENDFLMKCVMRIILTAGPAILPTYERILSRLVAILRFIMQNPSNPQFSQFTFESITSLNRIVCTAKPEAVQSLEQAILPVIEEILQQDIDQFVQYAFQVLAQLLENYPEDAAPPAAYSALVTSLVQPAWWAQRGSVPALVRLLRAYLARAKENAPVEGILGVLQQRLIPSKINDEFGFELLEGLVQFTPVEAWAQFTRGIFMLLLNRLQTAKTDRFVYYFVHFLLFTVALQRPGLDPDWLVNSFDVIQPGLFGMLFGQFVLEQVPQFAQRDRKVAVVGMARLLSESQVILANPDWGNALRATLTLYGKRQAVDPQATISTASIGVEGTTEIELEEANAGYQAAPTEGPIAAVADEGVFLRNALMRVPGNVLQQSGVNLGQAFASIGS